MLPTAGGHRTKEQTQIRTFVQVFLEPNLNKTIQPRAAMKLRADCEDLDVSKRQELIRHTTHNHEEAVTLLAGGTWTHVDSNL